MNGMNVEEFDALLKKSGWVVEQVKPDGIQLMRWDGLAVIVSEATEQDGKNWPRGLGTI